jgi:phospholipid transport system transporter-binding protein
MIAETSTHTSWPPSSVASVALPADCTIRAIAGLYSCLRRMPAAAALDGTAVQRIDMAGVQLLLAFIRERRAAHAAVSWKGVSPALLEAARAFGLTTAMKLPAVI